MYVLEQALCASASLYKKRPPPPKLPFQSAVEPPSSTQMADTLSIRMRRQSETHPSPLFKFQHSPATPGYNEYSLLSSVAIQPAAQPQAGGFQPYNNVACVL